MYRMNNRSTDQINYILDAYCLEEYTPKISVLVSSRKNHFSPVSIADIRFEE